MAPDTIKTSFTLNERLFLKIMLIFWLGFTPGLLQSKMLNNRAFSNRYILSYGLNTNYIFGFVFSLYTQAYRKRKFLSPTPQRLNTEL